MTIDIEADVAIVQRIGAVSTILDVVCRATGMGFAAVARVTEDRWVACQVLDKVDFGLTAGGELKVQTTLCHEVRQQRETIVIDDVTKDPVYSGHHTPQIYGLQSYISVPITLPDGNFFGTLCAIDSKPASLKNPQILGMFRLFADLIAFHFEAEQKLVAAEASVTDEHRQAELRERFIAVLGHDLRNPLAALDAGTNVLLREGMTERAPMVLGLMKKSIQRMGSIIDNVLDLARGRLAGGLVLNLAPNQPIEPTLLHVIEEVRAGNPDRVLEVDIDLDAPVTMDHVRLAQLLSNLLGNALKHGSATAPIRVRARTSGGRLELSVANQGDPIPGDTMGRLFQPFYRDGSHENIDGLGLGLYICSEIARAHGGQLSVASDTSETRFTFTMPSA